MSLEPNAKDAASVEISATASFILKEISSGVGGWASSLEAPALSCSVLYDGKWSPCKLAPGKPFLKAGQGDCDIPLPKAASKEGLTFRLVFNLWFAIETSPDKCLCINGGLRPQTTLRAGDACILEIAGTAIAAHCEAASQEEGHTPSSPLSFKTHGQSETRPLGPSSLIGSAKGCALSFPELPPFAGIVFHHESRPYLMALKLPEGQLKAGGADALAPRELGDGMEISWNGKPLGTLSLPKSLSAGAPQAAMDVREGRLALLELSGGKFGMKTTLPAAGRSLSIGRSPENHLVIDSVKISRKHALLAMYDNSVLVLDSSTNGSFIEGERIVNRKMLHPGEIVQFGDVKFLLCHAEQPPPA